MAAGVMEGRSALRSCRGLLPHIAMDRRRQPAAPSASRRGRCSTSDDRGMLRKRTCLTCSRQGRRSSWDGITVPRRDERAGAWRKQRLGRGERIAALITHRGRRGARRRGGVRLARESCGVAFVHRPVREPPARRAGERARRDPGTERAEYEASQTYAPRPPRYSRFGDGWMPVSSGAASTPASTARPNGGRGRRELRATDR